MLGKTQIADIVTKFKVHASDTGSSEVQIALLTNRISALTEHLKENKKDHAGRRGLMKMVSSRKSLLGYLQKTDSKRHAAVAKSLDLR